MKQIRFGWLALGAALCALALGCGNSDFGLAQKAQASFSDEDGLLKIDASGNAQVWFTAEGEAAVSTETKQVCVKNASDKVMLTVNVAWDDKNPQIKVALGSKKYPLELAASKSQCWTFTFTPDPASLVTTESVLTVTTNDEDPARATVKIHVGIKSSEAAPRPEPQSMTFFDTPLSCSPQDGKIFNDGGQTVTFDGCFIDPVSPYFTILSQPAKGTELPGKGTPGNPSGNTSLAVKVRYCPPQDGSLADPTTMVCGFQPNNVKVSVPLSAKKSTLTPWKLSCDNASGGSATYLDFSNVTGGATEKCCTLANLGSSDAGTAFITQNGFKILGYSENEQVAADAAYAASLKDPKTDLPTADPHGNYSVAAQKTVKACVTYTPQATGPVSAKAQLRVKANEQTTTVNIALLGGTCMPVLGWAPKNGENFAANVGGKETRSIVIANQGCAELVLIDACVTKINGGTLTSCQEANLSKHFSLAGGFATTKIPQFGLAPIAVDFSPPDDKLSKVNHSLNLTYCPGTWDGSTCSTGQNAVMSLAVNGRILSKGETQVAPTLNLTLMSPSTPVKAGEWVRILANEGTPGTFPIHNYVIAIWQRPPAAAAWVLGEDQSDPLAQFTPDAPGEWKVMVTGQSYDEQGDAAASLWSKQTILTFEAY